MIQSGDDAGEQFQGGFRVRSGLVDVESDSEYVGMDRLELLRARGGTTFAYSDVLHASECCCLA
jgi:hypothetical protein